jgi:transposase-like protein
MPIEYKRVKVKDLLFDPHNPRLPGEFGGNEKEIFRFLVDEIGVDDLINSMASSGVIEGDPIIARPAEAAGKFYVIEGNRRIAALKLLNGEKIGDGEPEPSLPAIPPETAEFLKEVTVQVGWEEEKLEAYLGYKHVTATREWPPEAKARFVLERCKGDFSTDSLTKFAKRLGTTLPTLRRWLIAYLTLKQAETVGKFDPTKAPSKRFFGTFYTLLGSQEVQKFLSLSNEQLTESPVPADHLEELGEFVSWTIGTKKSPPFVNSRSQQKLDAVLASPSGLQHFRNKKNLDAALLYTEYNSGEITEKLLSAAYTIEECLTKIFDVKDDPKVISAIETLNRAIEKLKLNTADTKGKVAR